MQNRNLYSTIHAAARAAWRYQHDKQRGPRHSQQRWYARLAYYLLLPWNLLIWVLYSFVIHPISWVLQKAGKFTTWLAAIGVMTLTHAYDPLGIYSNSDRFTATIIYQIFSPELYSSRQKERVTVVLISDNDLHEIGESWPIEYGTHALILDEIQKLGPKSVFVDFGFLDKRDDETISDLQNTIANYQKGIAGNGQETLVPAIPLMFASTEPNAEFLPKGAIDSIADTAAMVSAPGAFYTAFGRIYPLWDYKAIDSCEFGKFRPSPALAAFAATSGKSPENFHSTKACIHTASFDLAQKIAGKDATTTPTAACTSDIADAKLATPTPPLPDAALMEVVWGVVPPARTDLGGFRCDRAQPVDHSWHRAFYALSRLFKDKEDGGGGEEIGMLRQTCGPHVTIGASQLLKLTPLLDGDICGAGNPDSQADHDNQAEGGGIGAPSTAPVISDICEKALALKSAIQGRHIIYGGNLSMATDIILSPTHTPLPGAYFHAMALDNLLEYSTGVNGTQPGFRVAKTTWFGYDATLIIEISVLLFYLTLWDAGKYYREKLSTSYLKNTNNENITYEIQRKQLLTLNYIKIEVVCFLTILSIVSFLALLLFFLNFTNIAIINFTAILGLLALREVPRWFIS